MEDKKLVDYKKANTCLVFATTHLLFSFLFFFLPNQDSMEGKKLVDFKKAMSASADVAALREEVHTFARGFYMPGWDPKDITV